MEVGVGIGFCFGFDFELVTRAGELTCLGRGAEGDFMLLCVPADEGVAAVWSRLRVAAAVAFFTGVRILERVVLIDFVGDDRGVSSEE